MSLLCLNYWGLNSPREIQVLGSLIQATKPFIIFLSQTKCLKNKMDNVIISLGFDCGFFVDRISLSDGLGIF